MSGNSSSRRRTARIRAHHGFVPPHLLDEIARRGGTRERDWALGTLAVDVALRAARAAAPGRAGRGGTDAGTREGTREGTRTRARAGTDLQSAPVATAGAPRREVHDARHSQELPGRPVRSEGQPRVPDVSVDEAYDALGSVHRFWWEVFQRDSIDAVGMALVASVHFGRQHRNAFWNGTQMVFGDGDGILFQGFTRSMDVVGHELAHGITQNEAGLAYFGQAGALNESLSDVFGVLVRQWALGQSAGEADWLIGAGVFGPTVQGAALRSMKAPGTAYDDPRLGRDPQPAHMRHFVRTVQDNGGVHINSGIPNHAFYLAASQLGGPAWGRAGRIWYAALRDDLLTADASFARFAGVTCAAALRLHGEGSEEAAAVSNAWFAVGVTPQAHLAAQGLEPALSRRPAPPSAQGSALTLPR